MVYPSRGKFLSCIQNSDILRNFNPVLKCLIAKLSSESPNDPNSLTALARTHTAYQREAENALYETLYIHISRDDSLKYMETLARKLI